MNPKDEETEEPDFVEANDESAPQVKGRRKTFGNVRRDLTEEELASPGVQKMMLDEIERMDAEVAGVVSLREKNAQSETKVAIFEEKFKSRTALEIVSTGTITIGSAFWGLTFSAWTTQPWGYVLVASGTVLVIVGIVVKIVRP